MADIRRWMEDPNLLGKVFGGDSWNVWRALLAGFDGLPLDDEEARVFASLTGRKPPTEALEELWLVIGRRGGKSNTSALLAVVLAVMFDPEGKLAPGEVATVMVIAQDKSAARTVFRYVYGLINGNPLLEQMVTKKNQTSIELNNRVVIEIHTASYRAVRSYTLLVAILDEVALWYTDGANPDAEILAALRPGLGTLGGRLIALSSPYARRGVLWETYRKHYGKDGPILVAQAPTRALNPTFPQGTIDRALAEDPARAGAEYLAQFRTDVETFVSREAVEACVEPKRLELPPVSGVRYRAFVDPSGGSSDSMTLAIAHQANGVAVLDAVRERKPPFSPADVVREFAGVLKRYRLREVTGDRYAGEWPRERFREAGITYRLAERNRSELYGALLPAINSQQVELLDNARLVNQLVALERRTSRGGKDSIDHPPGGHDDLANAAAGVLTLPGGIPWGVAAVADEVSSVYSLRQWATPEASDTDPWFPS